MVNRVLYYDRERSVWMRYFYEAISLPTDKEKYMEIFRRYITRYKLPFFASVACVGCEAFCDLLGPTLMARIINYGIEEGQLSNVLYWGIRMLLVTFIGAGFAISRNILASRVSQRVGADLRHDLFQKIIGFSEASADKIESGSLITRMTNDTTQITQFVNGIMRIFFKAPITCVGSIVLATVINFRLSVIIYSVVALIGTIIFFSMKWSYPRFARLQKAMDRMNAVVQEYLIGVRLVKAFGTYDEETDRFGIVNDTLYKRGVSSQMIITFTAPIITLVVGLGTAFALYYGSRLFTRSQILPGDISAFTIYMTQMLNSLLMITNIFNTFVRTKASTARIMEVLDCEDDYAMTGIMRPMRGGIRFEHVTFTYPNGSGIPAINDISFEIAHGESLAVIGPTGSGKSTICWLLMRFYDANKGRIFLDGEDIRTLPVDTVRGRVAIVPQKPMLFSGTVADNIKWGDPNAPEEAVRSAAEKAQAQFVEEMPQGYQSILSSAAVNISGGQKQRISIARGLLKNASILILDDATSALDAITEAKVRAALEENKSHQTVVTITQRCTTAMFSDKILVMENGGVVGFGTHAQLMQSCTTYGEIYRSQVDNRMEG